MTCTLRKTSLLAMLIGCGLLAQSVTGNAQDGAPAESQEISLRNFLRTYDSARAAKVSSAVTEYAAVFKNLDTSDKTPQAIVYLESPDWCGSGGCPTLILKQKGNTWEVISKITVTKLPICVFSSVSHQWHSLGVWISGGGANPGYEAQLDFDGTSYPLNPTVSPAKKADKACDETMIPPEAKLTPLNQG